MGVLSGELKNFVCRQTERCFSNQLYFFSNIPLYSVNLTLLYDRIINYKNKSKLHYFLTLEIL